MEIMNTSDQTTIIFKSERRFYELESAGKKSNTIRTLDREEYNLLLEHPPSHIKIEPTYDAIDTGFTRELTHTLYVGSNGVSDTYTMLFSWG